MTTILNDAETELPSLSETDKQVLKLLLEGKEIIFQEIAMDDAPSWGDERTVSAELIAWLCSKPSAETHLKPHGIRIQGAKIKGRLALNSLCIPFQLSFLSCFFPEGINLKNSTISTLNLAGSRTAGVDADGLVASGDILLNERFKADRPVCLSGATVKGDVKCSKGHFSYNLSTLGCTPPLDCEDCRSRTLHAYALVLERAKIDGSLYLCGEFSANGGVLLADSTIGVNLNCTKGKFIARHTEAGLLKMNGRRLACEADVEYHLACALNCDGLHVKGNMLLNETETRGEMRLTGAHIDGDLESVRGNFLNQGSNAISADRLRVGGNVFFCDRFKAEGLVRLQRTEIGADLSFFDSKLTSSEQNVFVLNCDGMRINGTLYLHGVETKGGVNLYNSTVGGNIDCSDSKFLNRGGKALMADNSDIKGSVFLKGEQSGTFQADGCVSLSMASIGLDLICNKGQFEHHYPCAIKANGLSVGGKVEMEGATVIGGLGLDDAIIGSNLRCTSGSFSSPWRIPENNRLYAISAGKLQVGGSMYLDKGFLAEGEVMLNDVSVGRNLNCHGGTINKKIGDLSLQAQRITVMGSVNLKAHFKSCGEVQITDAVIGVDLDCSGGTFINAGEKQPSQKRYALRADGAKVNGSALFEGLDASGVVSLKSASIGRYFSWVKVNNPKEIELYLNSAKAGTLKDDPDSWSDISQLKLNGFEYQFLDDQRNVTVEQRLKGWLNKQSHFRPQPYEHLAAVLRRCGHEDEARKVLIEKNNIRRDQKIRWPVFVEKIVRKQQKNSVEEQSERQSFLSWFYQAFLGFFVSYGYSPRRALVLGLLVVMLGASLFNQGFKHGIMEKTEGKNCIYQSIKSEKCQCNGPEFKDFIVDRWSAQSVLYSLDVFLPVVDLNTGVCWLPTEKTAQTDNKGHERLVSMLNFYHPTLILLGWLITTLFLAALGGIMRR